MNDRSGIDRVLQVWMTDGPTAIPDRVVDVVAARIGVQRQRRTWPFPGRTIVNTYAKLVAAAAAILVVGFVGWQLLPGTTGPGGPSVAPTPSAQPTTPVTPAPSPDATFVFPTTGILNPGSHATANFKPAFTFSITDVWINDGDTAGGPGELPYYSLFPDTPANRAEWARTGNAAQHILIADDIASPYWFCQAWEDHRGATAAERVAKVTANETLVTTGVIDVEVGGLTGKQFDVRSNPEWTETCPGDPAGSDYTDARYRAILLDVPGGGVLTVFIGAAHAADFEPHLAIAMPVIESIEFDLGQ